MLNRIIRATENGWEYEADQRHGELTIETMKLGEGKGVSTPGEDPKPWKEEEEEK